MASTQVNRTALLVGAAVCAGSLAGCDAPESGSLENVKNRKVAPVDYKKLDYNKIDYSKIDYNKIDYSRLDPSKLQPEMLSKLGEKQREVFATKNLGLVDSNKVSAEVTRRLKNRAAEAEKAGDKELLANIDTVLKAMDLSNKLIGQDMRCW